jgi:hypothetical protein
MSLSVTVKSHFALLLTLFPFPLKSKKDLLVALLALALQGVASAFFYGVLSDDNIDSRIEPFNSVFVVIK